jgi:putative ABC transport system permease protein
VLGLGAGILMAIATTQLMTGLLFEVRALDAATFVSAPLLLGIVATIASYLPARPQRREKPCVTTRIRWAAVASVDFCIGDH